MFALRKDGTLRLCVDHRRLNTLKVRHAYPIPRMGKLISNLRDMKVFSNLDANSGYWQISIAPREEVKMTFTTHFWTFAFARILFGLKNAPATYLREIDTILTMVMWKLALVYLDDIIARLSSFEDHQAYLRAVLTLHKQTGVILRLSKSKFFHSEEDYLGHVIKSGPQRSRPT